MPRRRLSCLVGLLLLVGLVYRPGLSGPWLFDDFANIVDNAALRVTALDWPSLQRAATAAAAGPAGRPLAYLSFALDHYLHGASPYAYKLTNLAVHGLNTLLLAALLGRLFGRLAANGALPDRRMAAGAALAVTALWALHPLQLTSVLYVVQRMTSLAGTFTLAALLCWVEARARWGRTFAAEAANASPNTPHRAVTGWLLAGGLFWMLGLFTKETAVLLPLYALLLERILYPDAPWWQRWRRIPAGARLALLAAALVATFGLAAGYFAPGYAGGPFTLPQRVLTETRVLWFYIGLALLPRINAFGLHHDDIVLSQGLLAPWTTLPALLGLLALGLLAYRSLDRRPLVGLGIAWFLAGHVLESTVVPLEIAHEHRNYLPLLGLLLAVAGALLPALGRLPARGRIAIVTALGLLLAGTTALRASQWRDDLTLSRYEARHHPDSARARGMLAASLTARGDLAGAQREAEAAVRLEPQRVGHRMNLANLVLAQGGTLGADEQARIEALLREHRLSAFDERTLQHYSECIEQSCRHMAPYLSRWLDVYLNSGQPTFSKAYAWHMKGLSLRAAGDLQGALNAFERAHALDPNYLHPLFEQANIFLALRQWDNAAFNLRRLEAANRTAPVRQDQALAELAAAIAKGRSGQ